MRTWCVSERAGGRLSMHEGHEESKVGCVVCDAETSEVSLHVWRDRRIIPMVLSAILLSTGLGFSFVVKSELVAEAFFLATAVISGYSIAKKGLHSLVSGKRLSINFLMTVAAVGSSLIGHGEEGAAVVFLFYVAEIQQGIH